MCVVAYASSFIERYAGPVTYKSGVEGAFAPRVRTLSMSLSDSPSSIEKIELASKEGLPD